MQKTYPRTNPARFGASENSNVIPAPQIEGALRESVRQNAAHIRHEPENTSQVVTDVNSLVQRVADVSLDQLDDVIVDLRNPAQRGRTNTNGNLRLFAAQPHCYRLNKKYCR
jgi:hypothetical protein